MFIGNAECPKCGSKAKSVGMTTTTLMYIPETYDEDGKRVEAPANQSSTQLTCLNKKCGHQYQYSHGKDDRPRPSSNIITDSYEKIKK